MFKSSSSSRTVINGRSYSGRNVNIINGRVIVDGKEVKDGDLSKEPVINVTIEGDAQHVENEAGNIIVQGGITGDAKTSQGNIECGGDIGGLAKSSQGDVTCRGDIHGGAKTSMGDIKATHIYNGAKTSMGKVKGTMTMGQAAKPERSPDVSDIMTDIFGDMQDLRSSLPKPQNITPAPKMKPPKESTGEYDGPSVSL
jgi:hypothetical protein